MSTVQGENMTPTPPSKCRFRTFGRWCFGITDWARLSGPRHLDARKMLKNRITDKRKHETVAR